MSADVLNASRLLYAGAKAGVFPKILGRIHPKYATPNLAIIAFGSMIFILSVAGGFKQLAILASAAILLVYLAVILATVKLRKQKQDTDEKTFRAPGGLLFPVIGIAAIIWLLTSLTKWEILSTLIFIVVIALTYLVMRNFQNKNPKPS